MQFSFEAILLLISAVSTGQLLVKNFQYPFVRAGNTLIYFLIGLIAALVVMAIEYRAKKVEPKRFFVTTAAFLVIISILTAHQVGMRRTTAVPRYSNDGAVQTEEAAKFLLRGQNPYLADYSKTRFGFFLSAVGISGDRVAQTHYAYPPLIFLIDIPIVIINQVAGWRVDTQVVYMIFFIAWAALLIVSQGAWKLRTRMAIITLGLPFVWFFPLAGFNDIVFIFWLSLAAWAMTKERWWLTGVAMGLAVASKQTAAVALVVWLVWLWSSKTTPWRIRRRAVWGGLIATGVCYLPFLLWSPYAIYDDLVRYVGGMIPVSYPVSGITFLQYLRVWGITNSPWAVFPSWPIQLLVAVVVGLAVIPPLRRQPTVAAWLGATTILLLAMTLFTRFGAENYYVTIIMLAITTYAFGHAPTTPQNDGE